MAYYMISKEEFDEKHDGKYYFTDATNIFRFLDEGNYLKEISVPKGSKITESGDGYKSKKVNFGETYDLTDVDTIRMLISLGADINVDDGNALIWACKNGHLEIVKLFLEKDADFSENEGAAIDVADYNMHTNIVKYLFENGYKLKIRTALQNSLHTKSLDSVKFLVEKKGKAYKLSKKIRDASNFLAKASELGFLDLVKFLIKNGVEIVDSYHNDGALARACKNGHLNVVKYLVKKGADINKYADEPLLLAIQHRHIEIIKFLIEKGAIIYDNDNDDRLMELAEGQPEIFKIILDNGVVPTKKNILNYAKYGDIEILKYFYEKNNRKKEKTDKSKKPKKSNDRENDNNQIDGTTIDIFAMIYAAEKGNLDVVRFLSDRCSHNDIKAENNAAIKRATRNGHWKVVKFLLQNGPKDTNLIKSILKIASKQNHFEIIESVIRNFA